MNNVSSNVLSHIFQYIDPSETPVDLVCKKWNKASKHPFVQQAWANIDPLEKIAQEWSRRRTKKLGRRSIVDLLDKNLHNRVIMANHDEFLAKYSLYRLAAIAGLAGITLSVVAYVRLLMIAKSWSEEMLTLAIMADFAVGTISVAILWPATNFLYHGNKGEIPVSASRWLRRRLEIITGMAQRGHFRNEQDLKVAYMFAHLYHIDPQITSAISREYNAKIRQRN